MQLRDIPEGTFFVLKDNQFQSLAQVDIFMRASGITGYPTSVAQIIHSPSAPETCGGGAFPAIVAMHTLIHTIELEQLRDVVRPEVFTELERALQHA